MKRKRRLASFCFECPWRLGGSPNTAAVWKDTNAILKDTNALFEKYWPARGGNDAEAVAPYLMCLLKVPF